MRRWTREAEDIVHGRELGEAAPDGDYRTMVVGSMLHSERMAGLATFKRQFGRWIAWKSRMEARMRRCIKPEKTVDAASAGMLPAARKNLRSHAERSRACSSSPRPCMKRLCVWGGGGFVEGGEEAFPSQSAVFQACGCGSGREPKPLALRS